MKEQSTKLRAVALAGIMTFGAGSAAVAVDLTGTWQGFETCEGFDSDGAFRLNKNKGLPTNRDNILLITQDDTDLNVHSCAFIISFNGEVINDPVDPDKVAQAVLIDCDNDPENNAFFGEMVRWTKANLKPPGSGNIRGKSILGGKGAPPIIPPTVLTCEWTYKRIDDEDPGVPGCGETPPACPPLPPASSAEGEETPDEGQETP